LKYQTKEAIVISIDHSTKEHATLVPFTHTHTHTLSVSRGKVFLSVLCVIYFTNITRITICYDCYSGISLIYLYYTNLKR